MRTQGAAANQVAFCKWKGGGRFEKGRMGVACGLWRSLSVIVDDVGRLRAWDDK
jgi:hypothetical protein